MARRAKTSFQPTHLIGIIAFLAVIVGGGYALMHRSSDGGGGASGGAEFSLREYLDNSNALGGNTYHLEGIISERLDNWRSADGRLFSVQTESGGEGSLVPVLVPSKFNTTNIQRLQRFKFTVRVQSETGLLEVIALTKA